MHLRIIKKNFENLSKSINTFFNNSRIYVSACINIWETILRFTCLYGLWFDSIGVLMILISASTLYLGCGNTGCGVSSSELQNRLDHKI